MKPPTEASIAKTRARTAQDLWRELRTLNDKDARRDQIDVTFLQLKDCALSLSRIARIGAGGTIERGV